MWRRERLVATHFTSWSSPDRAFRAESSPSPGASLDPPTTRQQHRRRRVPSEPLQRRANACCAALDVEPSERKQSLTCTPPPVPSRPSPLRCSDPHSLRRTACQSSICPAPSAAHESRTVPEDTTTDIRSIEDAFRHESLSQPFDTETGKTISHRGSERFGFASTVKVFAAAEFLRRTSADERDELVRWTESGIERAGYSPVTSETLDTGLTADELAKAAVRDSDDTAMNLTFDCIGGAGLDAALECSTG
ncbi:hypothetical protein GS584_14230 [Rhodococcus hoagii]|nr:hypothetical protein [Prescottella equi]